MLPKVSRALLVALAACGQARIIQMTPTGGIIELQGDQSKAMEQAMSDMNQKCGPNNFTIVKEGDEPVGTDTYVQENQQDQTHASRSGGTTTDRTTTEVQSTSPAMAHRIHFQCNGVAGQPSPPAGGPLPPPGT